MNDYQDDSKVYIMNNSCLNDSTLENNKDNYTLIGSINKKINSTSINIIKVQERLGIYSTKDSVLTHDIDGFNKQVLNFISTDDGINCEPRYFIFSNTLSGLIFKILKWRRCTGYLVIQKSDYRTRLLCYLHDEIKHNSQQKVTHQEKNFL